MISRRAVLRNLTRASEWEDAAGSLDGSGKMEEQSERFKHYYSLVDGTEVAFLL